MLCYTHLYVATIHHQSRSGFIAVRTSTLIIFGSYSSSMYPAVCVEAVEKLGKGELPVLCHVNKVVLLGNPLY